MEHLEAKADTISIYFSPCCDQTSDLELHGTMGEGSKLQGEKTLWEKLCSFTDKYNHIN